MESISKLPSANTGASESDAELRNFPGVRDPLLLYFRKNDAEKRQNSTQRPIIAQNR